MDKNLMDMGKAYAIVRQAMFLCGWCHLYHKVTLNTDNVREILYYSTWENERDFPLCCIIRGILFNQLSELYQILK